MGNAKGRYNQSAKREFEKETGWDFKYLHVRRNAAGEPVIPGRYGEIYPYGTGRIGVYVHGGRKVADAVRKGWLPICGKYPRNAGRGLEYSEEAFVLPAEQIAEAAGLTRAYRRPRYRKIVAN